MYPAMMALGVAGWSPGSRRLSLQRLRDLCLWTLDETLDGFTAFLLAHLVL